jgi:hypothetical protein
MKKALLALYERLCWWPVRKKSTLWVTGLLIVAMLCIVYLSTFYIALLLSPALFVCVDLFLRTMEHKAQMLYYRGKYDHMFEERFYPFYAYLQDEKVTVLFGRPESVGTKRNYVIPLFVAPSVEPSPTRSTDIRAAFDDPRKNDQLRMGLCNLAYALNRINIWHLNADHYYVLFTFKPDTADPSSVSGGRYFGYAELIYNEDLADASLRKHIARTSSVWMRRLNSSSVA